MVLGLLMAAPLAGACAAGFGSVALAFGYVLGFDFLRAMGHCNVEVFPSRLFSALPVLRYLIYTPTYVTPSLKSSCIHRSIYNTTRARHILEPRCIFIT
jgi:hypothetical protein